MVAYTKPQHRILSENQLSSKSTIKGSGIILFSTSQLVIIFAVSLSQKIVATSRCKLEEHKFLSLVIHFPTYFGLFFYLLNRLVNPHRPRYLLGSNYTHEAN